MGSSAPALLSRLELWMCAGSRKTSHCARRASYHQPAGYPFTYMNPKQYEKELGQFSYLSRNMEPPHLNMDPLGPPPAPPPPGETVLVHRKGGNLMNRMDRVRRSNPLGHTPQILPLPLPPRELAGDHPQGEAAQDRSALD